MLNNYKRRTNTYIIATFYIFLSSITTKDHITQPDDSFREDK
jgi:hypothetical protein